MSKFKPIDTKKLREQRSEMHNKINDETDDDVWWKIQEDLFMKVSDKGIGDRFSRPTL